MKSVRFLIVLILLGIGFLGCGESESPNMVLGDNTAELNIGKFMLGDGVSSEVAEAVISVLPSEIVEMVVDGAVSTLDGKYGVAVQMAEGTICYYDVDIEGMICRAGFYLVDGLVIESGDKRRYDISSACQQLEYEILKSANSGGGCSGLIEEYNVCS